MVEDCNDFQTVGRLRSAQGLLTANLQAGLGELVEIGSGDTSATLAEVIGFSDGCAQLMAYQPFDQLRPGTEVRGLGRYFTAPVGDALLGRVIDGLGAPIDGGGDIRGHTRIPVRGHAPDPMERPRTIASRACCTILHRKSTETNQRNGVTAC